MYWRNAVAKNISWISRIAAAGNTVLTMYYDHQNTMCCVQVLSHLGVARSVRNGLYRDFPIDQIAEAKAYVEACYVLTMDAQ